MLNHILHKYITDIESLELNLWKQGKTVTLDMLKDTMNKPFDNHSFLDFYKQETDNSGLKESTKKNHLTTLYLFRQYKRNINFQELNYDLITSFEHFLRAKGYHQNTIAKHMKHLKRYVNVAIDKEYINAEQYAFRKYKIKIKETWHTNLTQEELVKLEKSQSDPKIKKWQKSLDAFLFCCYTGLRYSDFVSLQPHNIVCINEEAWLIFHSIKTGTEIRIPLFLLFEGKALTILNKYKPRLSAFFQLKSNSGINKDLIKLGKIAAIEKHFSFHTARHTNATLLIYKGANITTVQKLLGHKNVKTTQIYSNVMDMTIIRDLEKCRK